MCTTDVGPVRQLQIALAALVQRDAVDEPDASVRAMLPALLTAFHQLGGRVADVSGGFAARGLAVADACASARSWLMPFDRMTPNAASAWVKRARVLRQLPALRAGALSGLVSTEHLRRVLALVDRVDVAT